MPLAPLKVGPELFHGIVQQRWEDSIAWDGGTGPEQTRNLFTLYAPAVLALLATLIAINPPERRVAR